MAGLQNKATAIYPYLIFNGCCREAMLFYRKCLGGELYLQTIGETALGNKMPAKMKKYILNATLKTNGFVLMATDLIGDNGLVKGNSVGIMLNCKSEKEIKTYYQKLSVKGRQTQPLKNTFYGDMLGELTDKYGNHWLLTLHQNQIKQYEKE